MRYRHLTMYEREVIEGVRKRGGNVEEAAGEIGRSVSTVSRELRRNGSGGGHEALFAHRLATNRPRAWRLLAYLMP